MNRRYFKRLFLLVISILLICNTVVNAAEETRLLPEGQSVSKNVEAVEPRGYLMAARTASISNNEDGTLDVYGQIIAHMTLDYASITLYLDRFNPDTDDWETISYQDAEFTLEEKGEIFMGTPTASYTLSGTEIIPGYYYRIRGTFIAKKDGRREIQSADTDGVLLTKIK